MLRCTICCRCFGLEMAAIFCLEVAPRLQLLWSRSGAPLLGYTLCCRCCGLEVVPNAEMYDLLPLFWSRSGAPMPRCAICCRCFGFEVVLQC